MMLDLSIDYHHNFNPDHYEMESILTPEDEFYTLFAEISDKLRVLGLKTWPEEFMPRLEKIQETTMFCQLEELWMKCPDDAFEEKFILTNAPRLRKVELVCVSAEATIILPWTQITHLTLSNFASDLSLEIFTQCINLEYFQCSELTASGTGTTIVRDTIDFPQLRFFYCLDCEIPISWRRAIGRFFQFPTLEHIIWYPDWSAGVEHQVIRQYPESIQTLEFQFRKTDELRIKFTLLTLNSLKRLKIRCCNSIEISVLDLLTPGKERCFLPSLQKLHLTAKSNEMTPKTVQNILTMVKLRRILTPAKLDHLVLSYNVSSAELGPWPQPFVTGIKEFVNEGMKVVIEAGDKDVYLD